MNIIDMEVSLVSKTVFFYTILKTKNEIDLLYR